MRLNGAEVEAKVANGYAVLERAFAKGDEIALSFSMPVRVMRAAMYTPNYSGKRAVTRGPLIYCLEEVDNGDLLWNLALTSRDAKAKAHPELLDGVHTISMDGVRFFTGDALYDEECETEQKVRLTFVPYYAWGNRSKGEMSVWVRKA